MTNLKMIVVDLDGTLVTGFSKYDKKSLKLLKKLALKYIVVIATGRPYRSSEFYYNFLNLDTPIINYNGSFIHNPKNKNFDVISLTILKEHILKIIKDNKTSLKNIFCEIKDDIFLWKYDVQIKKYLHLEGASLTIGNFEKTLFDDPNGTIVFVKEGCEEKLQKYIKNTFSGILKSRFWRVDVGFIVFEIYSPTTNKGEGVKKIAEYYGIDQKDIIAIGDGHNDIEMLNYAGVKVAMGGSHPDLECVANVKTSSVKKSGVYKVLKKYF